MSRVILPGQRAARLRAPVEGGASDGALGRRLGDALGEEIVALARMASGHDYWPRPFTFKPPGMPDVLLHRGEFVQHTHRRQDRLRVPGSFPFPRLAGGAGFASLSDLISEATAGGKGQSLLFAGKTGSSQATAGIAETLWNSAGIPGAGANPSALAGGSEPDNTTVGGLLQADPAGGDTLHFVTGAAWSSVAPSLLILYDRIWHGAVAMNSAAAQTVTISGGPNRYATDGLGNVIVPEIRTVLPATAHNNTIEYTDQAGNTAQSTGAVAGISSGAASRLDFNTAGQWCFPLAAGDTGVKDVTKYTCSAAVASGQIDLVLGHPLAIIPCPIAGLPGYVDGINSAFNLVQVLTDACLGLWNIKGAATASAIYSGQITLVSG